MLAAQCRALINSSLSVEKWFSHGDLSEWERFLSDDEISAAAHA